jgi:hypothetical protein
MSRDWFAVKATNLTNAKYRRLSPAAKGALTHVSMLGCLQEIEATWPDPDELRATLEMDGFAPTVYDELVQHGWIAEDDGGVVIVDWDAVQYAAGKEAQRRWEARRKRQWRNDPKRKQPDPSQPGHTRSPDDVNAESEPPSPAPLPRDTTRLNTDMTVHNSVPASPDMSGNVRDGERDEEKHDVIEEEGSIPEARIVHRVGQYVGVDWFRWKDKDDTIRLVHDLTEQYTELQIKSALSDAHKTWANGVVTPHALVMSARERLRKAVVAA